MIRNVISMTALNVAKAVTAFALSTLMAGLVTPAEYGLVAFSVPLMAFIMLLTDMGLSSAIVRHPRLSPDQAGAAIGFLGLAGFLGIVALGLAAYPMERHLRLEGLGPVLMCFGWVAAFSIWAAAPRALLERQLRYPQVARIEATALLLGLAAFGVGWWRHAGVFSLVAFHFALQATRACLFNTLARRLFAINLKLGDIRDLMQVGGWVFLGTLASYAARNVDRFVIGSVLGATSLGLYSLGYQFMTVPMVLLSWPVSGVLLSTLARLGEDRRRKVDLVCAIFSATAAFSFPLMAALMVGSRYPVEAWLSSKWWGVTEIIVLLAPVGAVQSIASYNGAVLIESGAAKLSFVLSMISSSVICVGFVAAIGSGLKGLIVTYVVTSILTSSVMVYYMCKAAGVSMQRFIAALAPGIVATLAGVAAFRIMRGHEATTLIQWIESMAGYAAAVILTYVLARKSMMKILEAFRSAGRGIAAASVPTPAPLVANSPI